MDSFDAIILGIIQGFTEFLPVSSSGHLELGKAILGDKSVPEDSLLFTVVLHFATALSTIVVFRKDIWKTLALKLKKFTYIKTQYHLITCLLQNIIRTLIM